MKAFFLKRIDALKDALEERARRWLLSRGKYVLHAASIDRAYDAVVAQRRFLHKSGHLLNGKFGRVPKARRKLIEHNNRAASALIEATLPSREETK